MLKPVGFIPIKDCTGCESCMSACALHCIEMVQNKQGFNYPYIDMEKCVQCGSCEKVCPVLNPVRSSDFEQRFYACRANDEKVLFSSSSGGLFTIIANYVIGNGGVVCGAAFDKNFEVSHQVITQQSDIEIIQGSKYVQSKTATSLRELRKMASSGLWILFVGTPCQVAGARRLLDHNNIERHIYVEIVCHGVPSPGVYSRYLRELENKYGAPLIDLNFRDKTNGWKSYRFKARFENGKELSIDGRNNPYVKAFIENLYLRECCTACRFKNFKSGADLTIGDFWGVELLGVKEYMDDKGVSLLCVNTDQGKMIFDLVCDRLKDVTETDLTSISAKNSCLIKPTKYNSRTRRFYKYLANNTVEDSILLANKVTLKDRIFTSLKYRLGLLLNAKS